MSDKNNDSRRDFLKKAVYVAPVVLTLQSLPAKAAIGSRPTNGRPNGGNGRPMNGGNGRPNGGNGRPNGGNGRPMNGDYRGGNGFSDSD